MKSKYVLMMGLALCLSLPAVAAKKKTKQEMAKDQAAMEAMMAEATRRGTPGESHKILEPLAGQWSCTTVMWMGPDEKPQSASATAEQTWVMGGRFLKQEFKSDWQGKPFEGLGYTGYDNIRGEYQSSWMDTMATGIMLVTGKYNATTRTLAFTGTFSCPMTGEPNKWMRSDWKIIDNDTNTYTSYFMGPDGKEFKSMEIVYKRVK